MKLTIWWCFLALGSIGLIWGGGGCGGDDGDGLPPRATGAEIEQGVVGTVIFEKRTINSRGQLSRVADALLLPARFVTVEAVLVSGSNVQTIARTTTDGDGRYGIGGTFPEGFRVAAYPESAGDEDLVGAVKVWDMHRNRFAVVSDPQFSVGDGDLTIVNVTASASDGDRVAGGFNIVDVVQRSANFWAGATGIRPDPVGVNWESGGPQTETFFDFATSEITLIGGSSSNLDSSDTDEYDDTVIAHEYNHFLVRRHAHTSSPGGRHGGEDLLPTLAFDEALADWFGTFVNGTSLYQDTVGNLDGTTSRCRFCDDLENSTVRQSTGITGIGSEQSIYEILWDFTDGHPEGPVDVDGDTAGIPADAILQAVVRFDPEIDYVHVLTLLDRLVERGVISTAGVQSVLSSPVDQNISFPAVNRDSPPTGRDLFPVPIVAGESIAGMVDALSFSDGGMSRNVEAGFNSVRYYKIELDRARLVRLNLHIDESSGTRANDLTLRLLTTTNQRIAGSATNSATERIFTSLAAGVYVIGVFGYDDSLDPNRATYTLEYD